MAKEEAEVDVAELLKKSDKIKALMRRDPRFITRLITVRGVRELLAGYPCVALSCQTRSR